MIHPALRLGALVASLVAAAGTVFAQSPVPGQSYYGRNNYIEYRAGDLPIILTSGHGGSLTPSEIPVRTVGTNTSDANTRELTLAIADEQLSFAAWRSQWDLPSNATGADDPFGTGRALLLDYALGLRPGAGAPPWQRTHFDNDRLVLEFARQPSAADVSLIVEGSSDLTAPWQSLASFPAGAAGWLTEAGVAVADTEGLVTVTDTESLANTRRRFLRVRIEQ